MEFGTTCFLYVAQCFSIVLGINHQRRVLQGRAENIYPYVVSLQKEKSSMQQVEMYRRCTGSLVAEKWVLTASQCLLADTTIVRYGDMTAPRNLTDSLVAVLKRFPHPNYHIVMDFGNKVVATSNDIGLLLLAQPIRVKSMGKLSAIDYKSLVGLPVNYAGYGSAYDLDGMIIQHLIQLGKMPLKIGEAVVKECNKKSARSRYPAICISPKCGNKNIHTTLGDLGGPVFFKNKIIGVVSGCNNDIVDIPVSTPVSPYLDWINSVISATE